MLNRSPAFLQVSILPETSSAYPALYLNPRRRVIVCRDEVQWILQYRNRAETVARADWRGRAYCTTREALIACCDRYCGEVDPNVIRALQALPEKFQTADTLRRRAL
jgi:hypothetical protein